MSEPSKRDSTLPTPEATETSPPPVFSLPEAPTRSGETEEPSTAAAPPMPPPVAEGTVRFRYQPLKVGERVGDFEIMRLLGEGAFARVFLARQISLSRLVALKVSTQPCNEARTLAQLEHQHIVRVFSESVDPESCVRLLCMQYVPGPTLDRIITRLKEKPAACWTGHDFLEALDQQGTQEAPFDPAAIRDRELLDGCDYVECLCWLGSRLAEALAHAHSQGVLHRDIKPANILVSPYGRPMLADFNVAQAPASLRGTDKETFGGTLPYMGPEHLDAFTGQLEATAKVDERSDTYSLAVVLYELATGGLPFPPPPKGPDMRERVRAMAAQRRAGVVVQLGWPEETDCLAHVIGRCLEPRPEARYQSAAELGRALEGCRELRRIAKELPPGGRLVRFAELHPFLSLAILALLPHCLGSIVNISYNGLRIVLTEPQQEMFARVTLGYNAVVYPICLILLWLLVAPVVRSWRVLTCQTGLQGPPLTALRRQVMRLPRGAWIFSALGWFPGALVFPMALNYWAGPLDGSVYGHFIVSFAIAGLIALTYSVFGVQFVVLRILYPRLWGDGQDLRQLAEPELSFIGKRLWSLQAFAVLIPLIAAILLLVTVGDQVPHDYRWLIAALICVGMAGFVLAVRLSAFLNRTVVAITGGRSGVKKPDSIRLSDSGLRVRG
jgi:eukaryotic-like serine/threonine-protein kinase